VCAGAFLGIISARKLVWELFPVYPNSGNAAEGGASAYPSGAAERSENAYPGAAPEGGYASGYAVDRSAQVKEGAAEPAAAAEGDAHAGECTPGGAAGKRENASPGTPPEAGCTSGFVVDRSAQVKERAAELAAAAEGDTCAGESTPVPGGGGAGTRERSFAAAETASGLARLPDLSPAAYGSLYLRPRLPLTGPMRSVLVFAPVGPGFRFGAFPAPMHPAVSAQVFLLWWKTSFLGNARDPFAEAIAALRLYFDPFECLEIRG